MTDHHSLLGQPALVQLLNKTSKTDAEKKETTNISFNYFQLAQR